MKNMLRISILLLVLTPLVSSAQNECNNNKKYYCDFYCGFIISPSQYRTAGDPGALTSYDTVREVFNSTAPKFVSFGATKHVAFQNADKICTDLTKELINKFGDEDEFNNKWKYWRTISHKKNGYEYFYLNMRHCDENF